MRRRFNLHLIFLMLVIGSTYILPATAQCTDNDDDGFFAEHGCSATFDCNDYDPEIFPGATEICDGFDNDCDGEIDNSAACDRTCDVPGAIDQVINVTNSTSLSQTPVLVWSGTYHGVVWADDQESPRGIYFRRLSQDGESVGSALRVSGYTNPAAKPDIVWDGTSFEIVWVEDVGGLGQIFHARISENGVVENLPMSLTTPGGDSGDPAIAWNGQRYGLAWVNNSTGQYEVYVLSYSKLGDVGPEVMFTNSDYASEEPYIAPDESGFAVVWVKVTPDYFSGIWYQRTDNLGSAIGLPLEMTDPNQFAQSPAIVDRGDEYGLAWSNRTTGADTILYFKRISEAGAELSTRVMLAGGEYYVNHNAIVATTGLEYGVSWDGIDSWNGYYNVYFTRIDENGSEVGNEMLLTPSSFESRNVSLVWDGTEYAVVWSESGASGADIQYLRIGCDCENIDQDNYSVCQNDCDDQNAAVYPGAPQVCGDGLNNDCLHSSYPVLTGTNEWDDDSDGFTECDADPDCNDENFLIYPGAPQLCDGFNNDCLDASYPAVPADEVDDDGDIYVECDPWEGFTDDHAGGDCDDDPATGANTYPGAWEVNDGMDNQCEGDVGYGSVDETSGNSGFTNPISTDEYCWSAQAGATEYEARRSSSRTFDTGCIGVTTATTCWTDAGIPLIGEVLYYLNRPTLPNPGSWGQTSAGEERSVCP